MKKILKDNKDAKTMILVDSSQAPSTNPDYPEEFKKEENQITLGEVVVRSTPIITQAVFYSNDTAKPRQQTTLTVMRRDKDCVLEQ